MAKTLAVIGLLINLAGVILLFRYGMPYRVETKGRSYLLLEDDDAEAVRTEGFYRRRGLLGLALVVIGTGLQVWSVANG